MIGPRQLAALAATLLLLLLVSRRLGSAKVGPTSIVPADADSTEPQFEPVCAVDWKRSTCMKGNSVTSCPKKPHAGATPGGTGAWELTDNYVYFLDRGLLDAMVDLIDGGDVLEFGAGKGCYTAAFRRKGVSVRAFDGSPQVASLTHGLVQSSDLTSPLRLGRADWVVCLEVAEHIPREHEETLLQNLLSHARKGLVLSWSNEEGGNGHVNLRSNEWVVQELRKRGFKHDPVAQKQLRKAISSIHWYAQTVLVFRRARDSVGREHGRRRASRFGGQGRLLA